MLALSHRLAASACAAALGAACSGNADNVDAGGAEDGAVSDSSTEAGIDASVDADEVADAGAPDAAPDVAAGPACAAASTGTWLVTRFEFVGAGEGGRTEGFNVDGLVSTASDPGGCRKADVVGPDGTEGVDNQFATLLPALSTIGVDLDSLINQRVLEGTLLLVVRMNGSFSDCEGLTFQRGAGPVLFDADGSLTSHQTLDLEEGATVSTTTACDFDAACGGTAGGDSLVLEFLFISSEIRLEFIAWQSAFQVDANGSLQGLLGGAVTLDSVNEIVGNLGGCGDERIREAIEPLIPRAADVFPDETGTCQALSGALRIEAVPVYLFGD